MKHTVVMGSGIKDLTGKLSIGKVVVQPFIPSYSYLESLSIDFATYCKVNTADLKMEILDRDGKAVFTKVVNMSFIHDNEYYTFKTSIVLDIDRIYYIKLTGNGDELNSVTAKYCLYEDPITDSNLKLYLFEPFINGELSCIMIYSDVVDTVLKCTDVVSEKIDDVAELLKKNFNLSEADYSFEHERYSVRKRPFSIIVTAYNSADFIADCLDSIEHQTYFKDFNDYEILVGVDNCRTTLDKIMSISSKYRNLSVYMMSDNYGTYITTNTLISLAKYNNMIRFDSDDIMMENMIETIYKYVYYYDVIRFGFTDFNNDGTACLKKTNPFADGVFHFKKRIMDELFGGFQPWKCAADSEFLYRSKDYVKRHVLKTKLFYRRNHENSLTRNGDTMLGSELRKSYHAQIKKKYSDNDIKINRETGDYRKII